LNDVVFTVTAEDGVTSTSYKRSVRVAELSSNAKLVSLTVADTLVRDGEVLDLPSGTVRVSVLPVLESSEAKFSITGNTDLKPGTNWLVVTVTAPSGDSVTTTINVRVADAPSNTNLSTFTINDKAVSRGSTIKLKAGTTQVRVSALAEDAKASVAVTGKTGLKSGTNTLTVVVTALSGASTIYTVTVNVGN
jgi:hypothetical protein